MSHHRIRMSQYFVTYPVPILVNCCLIDKSNSSQVHAELYQVNRKQRIHLIGNAFSPLSPHLQFNPIRVMTLYQISQNLSPIPVSISRLKFGDYKMKCKLESKQRKQSIPQTKPSLAYRERSEQLRKWEKTGFDFA